MAVEYRVPHGFGEETVIEKKSRFIGRIWRVESEEEAVGHIKAMREQHWDASHNTYAYRLRDSGIMRYSDDGEPQGTAGMPILEVLRREEIENVCCVVTRYFGGTLLGAGGLTRTYGRTAKAALDAAGVDLMRQWRRLRLQTPYDLYEQVRRSLEALDCLETEADFGAEVSMTALIAAPRFEECAARITELTSGRVAVRGEETCFRGVQLLR